MSELTFDDGGTASGSFVYDADTDVYSNVRLKTTDGEWGAAAEFRAKCTTDYCMTGLPEIIFIPSSNQSDLTGVPVLDIEPSTPLTNAPETVDVVFSMTFICSNAACSNVGSGLRVAVSGQLVGTPYVAPPATPAHVPTINQWGLMLLSLLLATAALLHRRRKA